MSVFVSYAKSDVDSDEVARRAKLAIIASAVASSLGPPFVDEIHNHRGAHSAVEAALEQATSFCVVRGSGYRARWWTQWEYERALQRRIPMFELSCADLVVRNHRPS